MVFVTTGPRRRNGHRLGSPLSPRPARDMGAPHGRRGHQALHFRRARSSGAIAADGLDKLRQAVDTVIVIPNQNLLKVVGQAPRPSSRAFLLADDVPQAGRPGHLRPDHAGGADINIDFADVRTVMQGQGDAIMGIGVGHRPKTARSTPPRKRSTIPCSRIPGSRAPRTCW